MKRYTITAIKKDGMRGLAFNNDGRHMYETKGEADSMLYNIKLNNDKDKITDLIGIDLQVTEVECYPNGDATRTIF